MYNFLQQLQFYHFLDTPSTYIINAIYPKIYQTSMAYTISRFIKNLHIKLVALEKHSQ